jgi:hypothetical protein
MKIRIASMIAAVAMMSVIGCKKAEEPAAETYQQPVATEGAPVEGQVAPVDPATPAPATETK